MSESEKGYTKEERERERRKKREQTLRCCQSNVGRKGKVGGVDLTIIST